MRMRISREIQELSSVFRDAGYSLYLVGGAVRDWVLGKENNDYDFTTDAEPMEVKKLFRRTIDTGIKHGTVTVIYHGHHYEITTFRTEGDYRDSRHPESVEFVKSLEEDLKRRDFTINAFAASLPDGRIIDCHDGMKDLRRHLIRAIGDPEERFGEDALRMMRAARFSSQLGFGIEEGTAEAMRKRSHDIANVSAERIKEELWKLIDGRDPLRGLEAMRRSGLMDEILPELSATYGFEQGGMHSESLYEHSLLALKWAGEHGYAMRVKLASLLHDIGKVPARKEGDEGREWTFHGHEEISARMADAIFQRLKTSNEEREGVVHLIRNHMFAYTPDWSDSAIRRFIGRVGLEYIDDLFRLRICDMNATVGHSPEMGGLLALTKRINDEIEKENALTISDLKIDGNRLRELGIKPGPIMGEILKRLLDEVLEAPSLNNAEYLEKRALSLAQALGR